MLFRSDNSSGHAHDTSAMDILVDSDDEDEIFDDEDDEDGASSGRGGTSYHNMINTGVNAIVSPIQNVVRSPSHDEEDYTRGDYTDPSDTGSNSDDDDDERTNDDSLNTDSDDDDGDKDDNEKNGSDSGEDYTDDEDEGEDGYKPGGYHRVKIGEVYNQR